MASIPGSHYDIFAPNQTVDMALTYDANSAAPPVSGEFILEIVINSTGTGNYPTPPGYQGVLIETPPGKGFPPTLTMLHGNYGLVDGAGNDRIFLGDGSESIGGALGDTLAGGTGLNQSSTDISETSRFWAAPQAPRRSGAARATRSAAAAAATRRSAALLATRSPVAAAATNSSMAPAAISRSSAAAAATRRSGAARAIRSRAAAAAMRRLPASPARRSPAAPPTP